MPIAVRMVITENVSVCNDSMPNIRASLFKVDGSTKGNPNFGGGQGVNEAAGLRRETNSLQGIQETRGDPVPGSKKKFFPCTS